MIMNELVVHWHVDPAILHIGGFELRWYSILFVSGIILDPPAYGHGPDGEKWKLDELLFDLLKNVSQILAPRDSFMVLNLYSNGYSAMLGETTVREAFGLKPEPGFTAVPGHDGAYLALESGELALRDAFGKVLPLSIFVRLKR